MLFKEQKRDRGCIFYEYDAGGSGAGDDIKKGKMPKGYGCLKPYRLGVA